MTHLITDECEKRTIKLTDTLRQHRHTRTHTHTHTNRQTYKPRTMTKLGRTLGRNGIWLHVNWLSRGVRIGFFHFYSVVLKTAVSVQNSSKLEDLNKGVDSIGVQDTITWNGTVFDCSFTTALQVQTITRCLAMPCLLAARDITNSRKYERGLTYTRRHELHWLDIPERIQFCIAVTVHRCLNGLAPAYLTKLCTPVTQNRSSCRLRSSYCHRLAVPSVKLSIGSRSFSVSGPTPLFGMLYLTTLEIPLFPLMSSKAT